MDADSSPAQIVLTGNMTRADVGTVVAPISERVARCRPRVVAIDAGALRANVAALDALARVALAARRAGADVALGSASPGLLWLVRLAGLHQVLRDDSSGTSGSPMRGKIRSVARKNVNCATRPPANSST